MVPRSWSLVLGSELLTSSSRVESGHGGEGRGTESGHMASGDLFRIDSGRKRVNVSVCVCERERDQKCERECE